MTDLYLAQVELQDEVVILRNEFYNTERTVYLDGREHPANGERSVQGHSIGWWEGGTLVVDTRLFAPHESPFGGPALGIPGGQDKHVVERYTLSEDGREVSIELFQEDPEYLAEPFTATLLWRYSPHLELIGMSCASAGPVVLVSGQICY